MIKSGWSIVYIEGLQVIIYQNIFYFFLSLKISKTVLPLIANSANTDEML